jgi:redox-sensitive bicupin YhaK (pirin superfamily)
MTESAPGVKTIAAQVRSIGSSDVLRYLPTVACRTVGPFVFLDQMGQSDAAPAGAIDVPPHPHIGLATVTYLFEGAVFHRDSLGSAQVIEQGAVNWMTSGFGIVHSERTPLEMRSSPPSLFGVQCWVALPREAEDIAPSFEHVPARDLPRLERDGVEIRVVAGRAFEQESPVSILSPLGCASLVSEAGGVLSVPADFEERAIVLLNGEGELEGQLIHEQSMLVLPQGEPCRIRFTAASRAFFLAGPPLPERRFLDWNFCSTRKERIAEAKSLYREGKLGQIPGEEPQLPLPEDVR